LGVTLRKGWLIGSAACALSLYVLLWVGFVAQWPWIDAVDRSALEPLHDFGVDRPGWVAGWDIFCTVLGPTAFRLITLVLIVIALVRRNPRTALFLVISIELSGLVTEAAKAAANRPRPIEAFVPGWGLSFPSGHAVGLMVAVLALLTITLPVVRRPTRVLLVVTGVIVVVAIGVGRVVLNVHHPSDVLAGWALGYVWFVVCVLSVPPVAPITSADETPAAPGTSR
jgi:membrane-associated phospholipid phosphatase